MTRIYNKKSVQEKRRTLRKNMTRAEAILWTELKNKTVGERFLRQYSIDSYILDFYCPNLKLAIEVDGLTHQTEEEISKDKERQERIEKLNIVFLRFINPEIYCDLFNVIEKIKLKIEELKKSRGLKPP
jgi:very-short-patch-repair endonuclease